MNFSSIKKDRRINKNNKTNNLILLFFSIIFLALPYFIFIANQAHAQASDEILMNRFKICGDRANEANKNILRTDDYCKDTYKDPDSISYKQCRNQSMYCTRVRNCYSPDAKKWDLDCVQTGIDKYMQEASTFLTGETLANQINLIMPDTEGTNLIKSEWDKFIAGVNNISEKYDSDKKLDSSYTYENIQEEKEKSKSALEKLGDSVTSVVLNGIADMIFDAIGFISILWFSILTMILSFVGWVYDIAVFSITQYTTMPIVRLGWQLTLSITNVFFSIAMVVIAFATIMNQQTYGIKALLPKLILMAILINFSLPIAGVIIDASQIFMYWFINSIKGTNKDGDEIFAIKIANALQIGNIFDNKSSLDVSKSKGVAMLVMAVHNITLGSIFLIGVILAFIAGIVLIFVRAVVIWTLLITAPLAWFSYIIPNYKKYYDEWWTNFINQCVIGPVYFFFIWVAMTAVTTGGAIQKMADNASIGTGAGIISGKGFQEFVGLTTQFTMQYIILIGIMWAGVIIAPKIGGVAGAQASNLANSMRKGLTSMASKGAKWAGNTAAQNALRSQAGQGIIGGRLGKIPFLGTKLQEAAQKAQELKSDPYKNLSTKEAINKSRDAGIIGNSHEQSAIFKAMTEKGGKDFDEYAASMKPGELNKIIKNSQKYDPKIAQNALKIRPDLNRNGITNASTALLDPSIDDKQKRKIFNNAINMSNMSSQGFANADVQNLIKQGMQGGYVSSGDVLKFAGSNPAKVNDIRTLLRDANASGGLPEYFKQGLTNNSAAQILEITPGSKDSMIRNEIKENKAEITRQADRKIQRQDNANIDREIASKFATTGYTSAEDEARKTLSPGFSPVDLSAKIEAIRNREKQNIENRDFGVGGIHHAEYIRLTTTPATPGATILSSADAKTEIKERQMRKRKASAQKEIAENRILADTTKSAAFNQTLW